MPAKCANVQTATGQLNEAGRRLFADYGQHDQSPVLAWLPILLGLLASAVVALAFCPVPRFQTISGFRALFLSVTYLVVTVGTGTVALATCGLVTGWRRREGRPVWRALLPFCGVAAWMTPVVAFYIRDSLWAASTAAVLAALGSRLICRHHLAVGESDRTVANPAAEITPVWQ